MSGTQLIGSAAPSTAEGGGTPATFGKYRVLERLGEGGFGSVWRCRDDGLDRDVAVKSLARAYWTEEDIRSRFLREARALARVNHPNVVQVFDVGEADGGPFFVMELVSGQNASTLLSERGTMDEHRALRLCRQAVQGLQAAATAGVVHRDVKPANLMVSGTGGNELVKVTDFGLAFPTADAASRMTSASVILGTPEYMAPEQARGQAVDERADQYSLGCTLYEMVTGRTPFTGPTPQAVLGMHLSNVPEPPRVYRPDLTGPTQQLILRLMSREPHNRYANWAEVLAAMDSVLAGAPLPGPAPTLNLAGASPAAGSAPALPPVPHVSGSTTRAEPQVLTENLAMCFVDLLEFQERTSQQTRDENAEWVGTFADGMKRLVRQRGGRFIKQAYGTVLCTFQSPTDAVIFGMMAVDAAWEWSQGKPPLMNYGIRVGINLGEVRVERGDVFGDPVNVAARVMAKAGAGQVWFSDAVWLAMNRKEADAEGMGPHELKGVPVPVRLFRALPVAGHVASAAEPPFGTRKLASNRGVSDGRGAGVVLDKGAAAVAQTVGRAAGAAGTAASAVKGGVGMLRALLGELWQRVPAQHRVKVGGGLAAAAIIIVGGAAYTRFGDPYYAERKLLAEGRAGMAVRALETRVAEHPEAQWLFAKALYQAGKRSEALEQLEEALGRDAKLAHGDTLDLLLDALDMKSPAARQLIVKHYGVRAADDLKARVLAERYLTRHHAADALREMGRTEDVDIMALALKDIRMESECSRRQAGVRSLDSVADPQVPAALAAVAAARAEPGGDPSCVADALNSVERRLKKRAGKDGKDKP